MRSILALMAPQELAEPPKSLKPQPALRAWLLARRSTSLCLAMAASCLLAWAVERAAASARCEFGLKLAADAGRGMRCIRHKDGKRKRRREHRGAPSLSERRCRHSTSLRAIDRLSVEFYRLRG